MDITNLKAALKPPMPEHPNGAILVSLSKLPKRTITTTLMLLLYETSAEDGSRQHELPLVLE
jgi:hypothetical protein